MALTGDPNLVDTLLDDPPDDALALLQHWLAEAERAKVPEVFGMMLATANESGQPLGRVVSIKQVDDCGVIFGTSAASAKGRDLTVNPKASGTLWWPKTLQQIHLIGSVEKLADEPSDALFAERPRAAQAVATVSRQSERLDDERSLYREMTALNESAIEIPRPADWFAWRLVPERIEFWVGSPDRFHRRLHYQRNDNGWQHHRLQP